MSLEVLAADEHIARWRQRVWQTVHLARCAPAFRNARIDQGSGDRSDLAARGWHALDAGQHAQAQRYFRAVLHQDPYAVSAWVGLSRIVSARDERHAYLQAAFDLHHLINGMEQNQPPSASSETNDAHAAAGPS